MTASSESAPTTPAPALKPKAFLSYSQSSPEYVDRVTQIAEALTGHGVELVFDQWDLREGQDLHSFMEQAVNDLSVAHVLILCDPLYATKADDRQGGVGTETLILTPGVYRDVRQERVVPVIMARDDAGRVRVPTYLEGRAYIDLSIPEAEADGYEQLLRVLHGRRARVRPPLGPPPAFLNEDHVALTTSGAARLASAALTSHRADMVGRWADYLDRLVDAVAAEEIQDVPTTDTELAAQVFASIDRMKACRDEYLGVLRDAARYAPDRPDVFNRLHEFFERLVSLQEQHDQQRFRADVETENLGFITLELMLYTVAILVRERAFAAVGRVAAPLHVETRHEGIALRSLGVARTPMRLHRLMNDRSTPRWYEPAAQRLQDRMEGTGIAFPQLIEADLLLWFRTETETPTGRWYPQTLAYAESASLSLFTRIRQQREFARAAPALGVADRAEFVKVFRQIQETSFPQVGEVGGRSDFAHLLGIQSDER